MSQSVEPSCSRSLSPTSSKPRPTRNFLKFFFQSTIADRNAQNCISSEGSITQSAWNGMNKNAHWRVRLEILANLENVAKTRRLQDSTLESIWTETCDMLEIESLRKPLLRVMCSLTRAQRKDLGLALRLTFFETIKEIGFDELTLQWLKALTDDGCNIESFEYKAADLLIHWLNQALNDTCQFQSVLDLIQLIERMLIHNSAFIGEAQLKQIVHCFCKKICESQNHFIIPMLLCFEAALKYSHIPKTELLSFVISLCYLLSNPTYRQGTWRLFRILLSSVNAYTILRILQAILSNFFHAHINDIPLNARVSIVRGAIFCVAMALWGSQRIDSLRCSSSIVVPALSEAMVLDPLIACEVLLAVRRLVGKFGKSLQQLTWTCVTQLLEKAIKYIKVNQIGESSEIFSEVIQIILIIENFYLQNEYCGSVDALFTLVELCHNAVPGETILRLIDYRVSCIDPLSGNWVSQMLAIVRKYIAPQNSIKHREKALCVTSTAYHKHRLLYETDIVLNFALPVCSTIIEEKNLNFQYQLIMFLFDLAKTVRIRLKNELFTAVTKLIRSILNSSVPEFEDYRSIYSLVRNDNLEIMVCCISELLNERWCTFNAEHFHALLITLIEHLRLQYEQHFTEVMGSDVRARIFEALLLIQMDPFTQQLTRIVISSTNQLSFLANPHLVVGTQDADFQSFSSALSCVEFKWCDIGEVTIYALRYERCWSVLRKILECLSGVLEFRVLIYSAGQTIVVQLIESIISFYARCQRGEIILVEADELPKFLCPVLGKLINYTKDFQLCKILVECTRSGCIQAILTCDLAIQALPEKMALLSRQLIEYVQQLRPRAQLAIPVLELIGDSADIVKFHEFFQEKQFKMVIDILIPYANPKKFNVFIISSVFSVLMRWFVHIPEHFRPEISQYILTNLKDSRNTLLTIDENDANKNYENCELQLEKAIIPVSQQQQLPLPESSMNIVKPLAENSTINPDNYFDRGTDVTTIPAQRMDCLLFASNSSLTTTSSGGSHSIKTLATVATLTSNVGSSGHVFKENDNKIEVDYNAATLTAINEAMNVAKKTLTEMLNVGNTELCFETSNSYFTKRQLSGDGRQLGTEAPFGDQSLPMFSIGPPPLTLEVSPITENQRQGFLNRQKSPEIADMCKSDCIEPNSSSIAKEEILTTKNDDSNSQQTAVDYITPTKRSTNSATTYDIMNDGIEILHLFMRFWRKRKAAINMAATNRRRKNTYSAMFYTDADLSSLSEKSIEHWIVGNTILTICHICTGDSSSWRIRNTTFSSDRLTLLAKDQGEEVDVKKAENLVFKVSLNGNSKDVNESNELPKNVAIPLLNSSQINPRIKDDANFSSNFSDAESTSTVASISNDSFQMPNRFRRRNYSNVQGACRQISPYLSPVKENQSALNANDSNMAISSAEIPDIPEVEYVQLIIRHAFGKESWIMRSLDKVPTDFKTGSSILYLILRLVSCFPINDASSFLLHLCNGNENYVTHIPSKENEAMQRSLRILDKIDAEELHVVGVLYIGEEQNQESEILSNQYGSSRYMKFIKLLGDVISLDDDPGGLQKDKHGKFTYEYSDSVSRIVFLIATLMPNFEDDPKCNTKKSLIGNNFVSIVFNESGKPYRLGTVSGQFDQVALEVVPHDNETVVVTLHARREIACWMAMTHIFLSDDNAVRLLRKMAQRAQLSVNVWRSMTECERAGSNLKPYLSQSVDRLRKICALKQKGIPEVL